MTNGEITKAAIAIAAELQPLSADDRAKVRLLVGVLLDEVSEPSKADQPPATSPPFAPSGGLSR